MGVWGSIFGWKALFRWDVLAAIVPGVFVACGLGMLGIDWFPHNLLISQICLALAGLLFISKIIGHAVEQEGSRANRTVFAILFCGFVAAIVIFSLSAIES